MRHFLFSVLTVLSVTIFFAPSFAYADKLVMFDSKYCPSCIKFKREMAKSYWRSALGRQLPLSIVRTSNRRAMAKYDSIVGAISYTPTFVLISDGQEVGRFVGYNNKAQFLAKVKTVRNYWSQ